MTVITEYVKAACSKLPQVPITLRHRRHQEFIDEWQSSLNLFVIAGKRISPRKKKILRGEVKVLWH